MLTPSLGVVVTLCRLWALSRGRGCGAGSSVAFEGDDLGVVAAATTGSPKTSPQRPKGWFEVTMTEARS
jgi:hypothetical protein